MNVFSLHIDLKRGVLRIIECVFSLFIPFFCYTFILTLLLFVLFVVQSYSRYVNIWYTYKYISLFRLTILYLHLFNSNSIHKTPNSFSLFSSLVDFFSSSHFIFYSYLYFYSFSSCASNTSSTAATTATGTLIPSIFSLLLLLFFLLLFGLVCY